MTDVIVKRKIQVRTNKKLAPKTTPCKSYSSLSTILGKFPISTSSSNTGKMFLRNSKFAFPIILWSNIKRSLNTMRQTLKEHLIDTHKPLLRSITNSVYFVMLCSNFIVVLYAVPENNSPN